MWKWCKCWPQNSYFFKYLFLEIVLHCFFCSRGCYAKWSPGFNKMKGLKYWIHVFWRVFKITRTISGYKKVKNGYDTKIFHVLSTFTNPSLVQVHFFGLQNQLPSSFCTCTVQLALFFCSEIPSPCVIADRVADSLFFSRLPPPCLLPAGSWDLTLTQMLLTTPPFSPSSSAGCNYNDVS